MEFIAKAIETTGIVDTQRRLLLNESLPVAKSTLVRIIVLVTADKKEDNIACLPQSEDYVSKLAGLHKEVWQDIDTDAYLKQERDAWE
ncbi:hypothetical protein PN36_17045 [Candidatus Thiomargarita nelsonii]|uniref:Uncharacterized protein n=1 Tax=Candidatus Thiomargarita nelsonii TaxID=1003181 RepID=A0A4E0QSV3_9GAMM|nr:hypothetical protein PN36_17045 [Candidatus Thiomargarita nelsonii]